MMGRPTATGPFAKRPRQRIANPPSPVRVREGPLPTTFLPHPLFLSPDSPSYLRRQAARRSGEVVEGIPSLRYDSGIPCVRIAHAAAPDLRALLRRGDPAPARGRPRVNRDALRPRGPPAAPLPRTRLLLPGPPGRLHRGL